MVTWPLGGAVATNWEVPPPLPDVAPGYTASGIGRGEQWLQSGSWHPIEADSVALRGPGEGLPLTHGDNGCSDVRWMVRWAVDDGLASAALVRGVMGAPTDPAIYGPSGESTPLGTSGYVSGSGCESPGIQTFSPKPVKVLYEWERWRRNQDAAGGSISTTAGQGAPLKSSPGLSGIVDFDPLEAERVIEDYFGGRGGPLACYEISIANTDPDWAYEATSGYGFENSEQCRPSDGNQAILKRVDGRWTLVTLVGTGDLQPDDCTSLFDGDLGWTATTAVRRDFFTSIAGGQCQGLA